ncbi:hypothetical protein Tco_0852734 [Tanacetum coccineum]
MSVRTFTGFQKEVENQLGKTIKSLRSDRGGDKWVKSIWIIKRRMGHCAITLSLTRHKTNVVSESEELNDCNIVRSMIRQTTLPKSLLGYMPLRPAARAFPQHAIAIAKRMSEAQRILDNFSAEQKFTYLRRPLRWDDCKDKKIDTDDNLADPFNKGLAFPKHSELTRKSIVAS